MVLLFAALGFANLARVPAVLDGVTHLGYPAYLATILGSWQLLGAAAIATPVSPRLKEWAYAGMFFNLTGAAASHIASGDPLAKVIVPLVLLAVVMSSWRVTHSALFIPRPASGTPRPAPSPGR